MKLTTVIPACLLLVMLQAIITTNPAPIECNEHNVADPEHPCNTTELDDCIGADCASNSSDDAGMIRTSSKMVLTILAKAI